MSASYFMADLVSDTLSAKFVGEWTDAALFAPYQNQQALLNEVLLYAKFRNIRFKNIMIIGILNKS